MNTNMNTNMNTYIKSPINYTGGKYRLLNKIIPLFPENINTFVDFFGGRLMWELMLKQIQ